MPADKEAPFFVSREMMARGWDAFEKARFNIDAKTVAIGTASPQYMCYEGVPSRIRSVFPTAKLIAVVRHPVERAVSHYKMLRRWGYEERTFSQAIFEQLEPDALRRARKLDCDAMTLRDHAETYVSWGEYQRVLTDYFAVFPRQQILVLPHEHLLTRREQTYRSVLRFLGIDDNFMPTSLHREFNRGGIRRPLPLLGWAKQWDLPKRLVRAILSEEQLQAVRFWLLTRSSRRVEIDVTAETFNRLMDHYSGDVAYAEAILSAELLWRRHVTGIVRL